MTNCASSTCACTSCTQEPEPTVQIEHNIQVTHVMEKVVHLKPPKKASEKVVSIAGKCLDNPDGCSIDEIKSLSASHLSIRQGHDDPAFKAGRTFVEERYVMEDYDDSDESWEDHAVVDCSECTNLAAKDCDYGLCGRCCSGCSRHG